MAYRYKTVKVNGKTKLLHRHVAEQAIGRPLLPTEHVHHVNGDRHDNRPENLRVMAGAEHLREHGDERLRYPREKTCAICGGQFVPQPTKRKRKATCSKPCADRLRSMTEKATRALVRANWSATASRIAA